MNNKRPNLLFNILLSLAALLIALGVIISGPYFQGGYKIEVNSYSPVKFKAPKDTVNEIATERLNKEAAANVDTIYARSKEITNDALTKLETILATLKDERIRVNPLDSPYASQSPSSQEGAKALYDLGVSLTAEQINYIVYSSSDKFSNFCSSIKYITEFTLDKGVKENDLEQANTEARKELAAYLTESTERIIASEIISAVIRPNNLPDEEATRNAREIASNSVQPIIISGGQNIVDEGEKITEEIYHVLETLGYTNKSLSESIVSVAGVILVCIVAFMSVLMYIYYFMPALASNRKGAFMLFTLFSLTMIGAWLLKSVPYQFVPILLMTMLVSILLDTRLAIVFSFTVTIICSLVLRADTEFLLYFALTGVFAAIFARYTTERNRVFSIGITVSAVSGFIAVALSLLLNVNVSYMTVTNNAVYAILNGVLIVILCIGSLPFWEATFGVTTPIKLLDLANPSNKLLRRLVLEAPGTYHHSLIVANLAETAAYDIGANSLLSKVGGYYHDIGKLRFPDYFSENIIGENPHDHMSPLDSVAVLKEHVSYGLELAKEYRLPANIVRFIAEHHGNTMMKFFYYKALKLYPDEEINESDYRYGNDIPSSKETAIVMLADTAEAAVRSMIPTGKPMSEVQAFVDELIKDKLNDGQLRLSNLTLTDLDNISKSFMKVFKGMYHERIPYPKAAKSAPAPAPGPAVK